MTTPSAPKIAPKYLELMFEFYDDRFNTSSTKMLERVRTMWPEFAKKFAAVPKPKKKPDTIKQLQKATEKVSQEAGSTTDEKYLSTLSEALCQQMNKLPLDLKEKVKTMMNGPTHTNSSDLGQITREYQEIQEDIQKLEVDKDQQESLSKAVENMYNDMLKIFDANVSFTPSDIENVESEESEHPPSPKRRKVDDNEDD